MNQQSSWKLVSSVSNGRVAFHFRRVAAGQPLTLWRSTVRSTTQVNLSAVSADTRKIRDDNYFLTDKYLYLWTEDQELWQIEVNSRQVRQVTLPVPENTNGFNFVEYSEIIRDPDSDALYFSIFINTGDELGELDENAASVRLVPDRLPPGVSRGFSGDFQARVNGTEIFFDNQEFESYLRGIKRGSRSELLTSVRDGSFTNAVTINKLLYFRVSQYNRNGNIRRCEIWRTDGTQDGTFALTDCGTGDASSSVPKNSYDYFSDFIDHEMTPTRNNGAVFKKINWTTRRIELWRTDGTKTGTRIVKSFPYIAVAGDIDPDSTRLDLRKVGNYIWYKKYERNRRHTVWVSNLSLGNPRRVFAGRNNTVVDLMSFSNHMVIQQVVGGANATLFRTNIAGGQRTRIYSGRGHFYGGYRGDPKFRRDKFVEVGTKLLLPWKTARQAREFLVAHDLRQGGLQVRQRWNDVNESGARGSFLLTGTGDSIYFCGANGVGGRWRGERSWYADGYNAEQLNRYKNRIWITDGSPESIRPVISTTDVITDQLQSIDPPKFLYQYEKQHQYPYSWSYCGQFALSAGRLVYSRGDQIWSAKPNGTDAKRLLSSGVRKPRQIVTLNNGVLITSGVDFSGRAGGPWLTKRLHYLDQNGDLEQILAGNDIEIVEQIGSEAWFSSRENRGEGDRALSVTDGTVAGTRTVFPAAKSYKLVEVSGVTWLVASLASSSTEHDDVRLYRLRSNASEFELVQALQPGEPDQLIAHNNSLYLLQRQHNATADATQSSLDRINLPSGDRTRITQFSVPGTESQIVSVAELNNQIYYYIDRRTSNGRPLRWEIWRTAGQPGDAVRVHVQSLINHQLEVPFVARYSGQLKATSAAIWFVAADSFSGSELWQIKPD